MRNRCRWKTSDDKQYPFRLYGICTLWIIHCVWHALWQQLIECTAIIEFTWRFNCVKDMLNTLSNTFTAIHYTACERRVRDFDFDEFGKIQMHPRTFKAVPEIRICWRSPKEAMQFTYFVDTVPDSWFFVHGIIDLLSNPYDSAQIDVVQQISIYWTAWRFFRLVWNSRIQFVYFTFRRDRCTSHIHTRAREREVVWLEQIQAPAMVPRAFFCVQLNHQNDIYNRRARKKPTHIVKLNKTQTFTIFGTKTTKTSYIGMKPFFIELHVPWT